MAYWVINNNFKPFHDDPFFYGKTNKNLAVSGGIDTSAIDNFREGVNLRTVNDIFNSNQIKISFMNSSEDLGNELNGNLTHESIFQTFGQALDFTQFTGIKYFNDSHSGIEGNYSVNNQRYSRTVDYLIKNAEIVDGTLDPISVYPTYMNGGPQFIEEAIIEPLPIINRLPTNESPQETSRGVFAFFEGGNVDDERRFGSSVIEQMVNRELPSVVRPYLEYGSNYLLITGSSGNIIKKIESRPSAVADQTVINKITPWIDEPKNIWMVELTNTLDLLGNTVESNSERVPYYTLNYGTVDTEIQRRDKKSSTAGFSYYGGNASLYGTDSVAFGGLYRG